MLKRVQCWGLMLCDCCLKILNFNCKFVFCKRDNGARAEGLEPLLMLSQPLCLPAFLEWDTGRSPPTVWYPRSCLTSPFPLLLWGH